MRIARGDYIEGILNNRRVVALVTKATEHEIDCIDQKDQPHQVENLVLSADDVLINYGSNPHPRALEVYRYSKTHDPFGEVHFFYRCSKDARYKLHKSLSRIGTYLSKRKLHGVFPLEVHVRPRKGKYPGMYKYRPKNEEHRDLMTLRFDDDMELDYVVAHEIGHGIWFRLLSHKWHVRWMKLYHSHLNLAEITKQDCDALKNGFLKGSDTAKKFADTLEEPLKNYFKRIIEWIVDNHKMSIPNINTIIMSNSEQGMNLLDEVWPSYKILSGEHEIILSKYATKSVEETFAEAFAYHVTGIKMPIRVQKLLDDSLQFAAR